ncbi:F0F1 ATP synthase subunit B [Irregularibacter muris]|uniref:ATP synthase subunit b n=1 Tax=Irregularibacter muris TaxID=1796619 RepID=A0AAE3HGG5_9FIRM|nr:F0F1 ATP synthase subunit B [Irregularibacter muris]MCR1900205.1 F0F1 ATP synthase subunit B [Irregularibacter muris]
MGGEVGLVSIQWWSIIMQIVNTLILFAAVSYFLFKPVSKMLQDRKNKIAGDLEDAEKTKIEAEELKVAYQQKIDVAKGEAGQIIAEATRRGDVRRAEIVQEAEQEAKRILERANLEVQREKAKAMDQLKDDMIEIALAAAASIIQKNLDSQEHEKLVQQYIEEMGDIHV